MTLLTYIFLLVGTTAFFILCLDSYKISELRAEGNYFAANILFFKYFTISAVSMIASAMMRNKAMKYYDL